MREESPAYKLNHNHHVSAKQAADNLHGNLHGMRPLALPAQPRPSSREPRASDVLLLRWRPAVTPVGTKPKLPRCHVLQKLLHHSAALLVPPEPSV